MLDDVAHVLEEGEGVGDRDVVASELETHFVDTLEQGGDGYKLDGVVEVFEEGCFS